MGLMEQIATDIQQITTNANEFAVPITFTPPVGDSKICNGIGVKHSLAYDQYGAPVASKTARVSVSERALVAAGIMVRNSDNEVDLINFKVTWTDIMNITWDYRVKKNIPGETTGSIVLILEDIE